MLIPVFVKSAIASCIFIEIRVEDSLIHEPRVVVEEHPAEVVELEGREHVRITLQRFRQIVSVVADRLSCSRLDFRYDREPVTRRCSGKNRSVFSLRQLAGIFRNDNCLWLFPFL